MTHWQSSYWKADRGRVPVAACNYRIESDLTTDPNAITCKRPACEAERIAEARRAHTAALTMHGFEDSRFQVITPEGALTGRLVVRDDAGGCIELDGLDVFALDEISHAAALARQTIIARDHEAFERAYAERRDEEIRRRVEAKIEAEIAARQATDSPST